MSLICTSNPMATREIWDKFPEEFTKSKISRAQRGKFNFVNFRGKFDPKFPEKAWDSWLIPLYKLQKRKLRLLSHVYYLKVINHEVSLLFWRQITIETREIDVKMIRYYDVAGNFMKPLTCGAGNFNETVTMRRGKFRLNSVSKLGEFQLIVGLISRIIRTLYCFLNLQNLISPGISDSAN